MNGNATPDPQASAYSFYLNLVVLDHVAPSLKDEEESKDTEQQEEGTASSENLTTSEPASTVEADCENGVEPEVAMDKDPVVADDEDHYQVEVEEEEELHDEGRRRSFLPSMTSPGGKAKKADLLKKSLHGLDQSLRSNMRGLSKRSTRVANKAGAFAARKTMVSRAMQTLNKCLPELSADYDEDLTIGKRFSQGKVTVLHVVLKPSAMSRYLAQVKGDHSATRFSEAMSTLESLGATDTMKSLEREMLMQVRNGLMDQLSTLLLQKMNEKGNGLELECIALEEAEEARWLFTFMEFQEQMKL